jgi:hypothetical protein
MRELADEHRAVAQRAAEARDARIAVGHLSEWHCGYE